jgi:NarL family two-component system response regulator YdfI
VISVAVLASNPMARARLEALVAARPGLRLVASASRSLDAGGHTALASVEADVLLIEPGARRVEAVLKTLPPAPRLPPVVLLEDNSSPPSVRLLRAGVWAILPREAAASEIAASIEAVAAGLVVLHPSAVPGAAAPGSSTRRARGESMTEPLTRREMEVLGMMAEGLGNRAIAKHLGISTHTVKFHVAAILDKLHARSRTAAVSAGVRLGLLMV